MLFKKKKAEAELTAEEMAADESIKSEKEASRRRKRYGTVATAITAAVVAVVIVLNVLLTVLIDRYPLSIDLTDKNLYDLSADTIEYIKGIDKDVTIHILSTQQKLSYSYEYLDLVQAAKTIEAYAKYSSHITVDYVDLTSDPSFINSYPDYDLATYDVIVECDGFTTVTNLTDMFTYSYQYNSDYTDYSIAATSNVEQNVTNSIMYAVSGVKTRIAVISGFDEVDSADLETLLSNNNYEIVDLNLLTEAVPEDVSAVIWFGPKNDPDEATLKKLDIYLEGGGNLLVFRDPFTTGQPTLDAFLAEWGLSSPEGFAFETDSSRTYNNSMYYPVVSYSDTNWSSGLESKSLYTVFYAARPVELLFDSQGNIKTSTLLSLSDKSGWYAADVADDYTITESDIVGNVCVGALAENSSTGGKVFLFGTTYSFLGDFLTSTVVSNAEYIAGVFNTLCQRENAVVIASKDISTEANTMTTNSVMMTSIVFVILVPLVLLGAGVFVYVKRKHK